MNGTPPLHTLKALVARLTANRRPSRSDMVSVLRSYSGNDWESLLPPPSSSSEIQRIPVADAAWFRVRILRWPARHHMPFHTHPGFDSVGMRVLAGGPLLEEFRWFDSHHRICVGQYSVSDASQEHRVANIGSHPCVSLSVDVRR